MVVVRVVVGAALITIGALLVAHGLYQARHPDWRERPWWGRNRVIMLMLGGSAVDLLSEALERRSRFKGLFGAAWAMLIDVLAFSFGIAVLAGRLS